MKKRYKILNGFLIILVLAIGGLMIAVSRTAECPAPAPVAASAATMRAVLAECYGGPEVLQVRNIARPSVGPNEILVKIEAAAVNPLDWHYMRGSPYLMRLSSGLGAPEDVKAGVDFAGTVEAIGGDVTEFSIGDAVFGGANGAFAEYVVIGADRAVVKKPDNLSYEEAAALPIAAVSALQALQNKGRLVAGQKVLINGASGGVGTFAVQIAKALGAEVTGVSSARNHAMVQSLGADRMIDYKTTNYTELDESYDLIIDMVGNHSLGSNMDVLQDDGRLVQVGGPKGNWIAPLINPLKGWALDPFYKPETLTLLAILDKESLTTLAELASAGKLTARIDRRYPLEEVAEAIRYSETGRARGKIILQP